MLLNCKGVLKFKMSVFVLKHSAKGSTWEKHKYIKRLNGTYYYPNDYEGGRHIESLENNSSSDSQNSKLDENDLENLADEVIRGNFGNGQIRKDLLGEYYQEIQDRVNQILKPGSANIETKISEVSNETIEKGEKKTTQIVESLTKKMESKGIDLDKVYSVYKKGG